MWVSLTTIARSRNTVRTCKSTRTVNEPFAPTLWSARSVEFRLELMANDSQGAASTGQESVDAWMAEEREYPFAPLSL